MATAFDQLFDAEARGPLRGHFGTAVTYRHSDGSETAATAVLGEELETKETGEGGRQYRREREAALFKDEVPVVSMKGNVTIHTEIWSVDEILGESGSQTICRLVRIETAEVSQPDYRRE